MSNNSIASLSVDGQQTDKREDSDYISDPMNKRYRVFTSASLASSGQKPAHGSWISASSVAPSLLLPAEYDRATQQISRLYQNVIFGDSAENEEDCSGELCAIDKTYDTTVETDPQDSADVSAYLEPTNQDCSLISESYDEISMEEDTTFLSEGNSISHFPVFNFNVNDISSLSSLIHTPKSNAGSRTLNFLLGVMEVDGPNYVTVKTGPQAGNEVALLKIIVGDEQGAVCKVVVWRETAEVWGGLHKEPGLKRGDIVLFENVAFSFNLNQRQKMSMNAQIVASPNLKSNAVICYRTLPRYIEDKMWRPDLRLASSVPAVRKVRDLVSWMERMAGIPTT